MLSNYVYISNKHGVQPGQLFSYWLTDYGIIGLTDSSNSGRCQRGVVYFSEFREYAELTRKNETVETFMNPYTPDSVCRC